ncbi:MAG: hypothetical protein WDO06_07470 [Actinomycetota bacterium]
MKKDEGVNRDGDYRKYSEKGPLRDFYFSVEDLRKSSLVGS